MGVPILKSRMELKYKTFPKFEMKLWRTVMNTRKQRHKKFGLILNGSPIYEIKNGNPINHPSQISKKTSGNNSIDMAHPSSEIFAWLKVGVAFMKYCMSLKRSVFLKFQMNL